MTLDDLTLDVEQHVEIKAASEKVFAAVLHRFGKGNTRPDGQSLELLLEAKPGGRWYRDRGLHVVSSQQPPPCPTERCCFK